MKRLVRTSSGWVELDIRQMMFAGFSVRAAVFSESGWASAEETWNAKYPIEGQSLERFLAEIADIPDAEAALIVEESLRAWRERGGADEARGGMRETIAIVATTFGLAGLGALSLAVLLVFVVFRLV